MDKVSFVEVHLTRPCSTKLKKSENSQLKKLMCYNSLEIEKLMSSNHLTLHLKNNVYGREERSIQPLRTQI